MVRKKLFWMITLSLLFLLIPSTIFAQDGKSKIVHQSFQSDTLNRDYHYNIYLPPGYESSNEKYPVLYLLHGSNGNENNWLENGNAKETADTLIKEGKIPSTIIVMPASKSWWVDGYNEKAETAFFEDLIPHIDDNWRTIAEKEGRLVAGLSAGGYGTVNFILKRPDMFAAGAALSPAIYTPQPPPHSSAMEHPTYLKPDGTFDPEKWEELNYPQYIEDYKQQNIKVPLYINSGDHDTFDIAYHAAVLYQELREHQADLVEFRVVDGDHEWNVWKDTLPEAMVYMYRFVAKPERPSLPIVDPITDVTREVTGTAETNTTVVIKKDGSVIGEAKTDENGNYRVTIPAQQAGIALTITATNAAGIVSEPTEVIVSYTSSFTDTIGHWAEVGIGYLKDKGITSGYPDGSFGVNKNISRGEAAAFLARALELDTENVPNPNFPDVAGSHPYYSSIAAIFEEGIISGNINGLYEPDASLTRAEMAVILVKGFGLEATNTKVTFTDVLPTHWAHDAVHTLASNEIASGYPDGTFGVNQPITRAEFGLLLANVLQK